MAEKSGVRLWWEVGPQAENGRVSVNFVEFGVDLDRPLPQEAFEQIGQVVYEIGRLVELLGPPAPVDDDFVQKAIEKIEATRVRLAPAARVGGRLVFSVPIGDVDPDLRVFEWSRLERFVRDELVVMNAEGPPLDAESLEAEVSRALANLELIRVHGLLEQL